MSNSKMAESEIRRRLNAVFHDVFDDDSIDVGPETVAADVEQWDSLGNIRLMISIEQAFGIRFDTSEIGGMANVGELLRAIGDKLGK